MKKAPVFLLLPWVLGGAAVVVIAGSLAYADGIPETNTLYYSGVLEEGGAVVDGTRNVVIRLFDDAATGTERCVTNASGVSFDAGRFRVPLVEACVDAVRDEPDLWVEVQIGADAPFARTKLGAVPYAVEAERAQIAEAADRAEVARSADRFVVRDGLEVSGPVELFGDVQSVGWELGVEYTASTDGFVVAYSAGSGGGSRTVWVGDGAGEGWVCRVTGTGVTYATNPCPVKRGSTWRVEGTGSGLIKWVPFGSD